MARNIGLIKLNKKQCKLAANLYVAGLLKNYEPVIEDGVMTDETETAIVSEILNMADRLQKEHPKFGSITDAVNYVNKL